MPIVVCRKERLVLYTACNVTSVLPTAVKWPVGGGGATPPLLQADWQRPLTSLVNNNDARWALKDKIKYHSLQMLKNCNIHLHLWGTGCDNRQWTNLAQKLFSGGLWYGQWQAMVLSPLGYGTVNGAARYCQYWAILSIMDYGTTILCNGIVNGELR